MFADDTCCLDSDDDLNNLIQRTNTEINKIALWFRSNKMATNTSKTKYIIFRARNKPVNMENLNVFYDANDQNEQANPNLVTTLERIHTNHDDKKSRSYKLLGVLLDEFLSLDYHVDKLCSKLNRSLYCIRQAKHIFTVPALKSLYFALINSHLTYCPIILNCTSKNKMNRIFKIQKKAIRIITKSAFNDHTALFIQHNILPFEKLIEQAKLLFMHGIEYNYALNP
jgi:hypothetical protein